MPSFTKFKIQQRKGIVMRRVEITEETLKLGRMSLTKGDSVSLDDDIAKLVIDNGWGKCAKTGEQGERKTTSVKIEVDAVVQKIASL